MNITREFDHDAYREMKATELRIGNWVKLGLLGTQNQVTQILEKGVNCGSIGVLYEMIKPIPLTEELLTRFGFKQIPETNRFYLDDKNTPQTIYIDLTEKDTMFGSNEEYDVAPCLNVHQLQNLYFALTGQELQTDESDQKVNQ